jgi:hypothetical protein
MTDVRDWHKADIDDLGDSKGVSQIESVPVEVVHLLNAKRFNPEKITRRLYPRAAHRA